jgi:hypothetical protein
MARPSSVWWWAARGRWAFTVGKRRHVAPKSIGEHDVKAAERWHDETVAREYPERKEPEVPRTGRVRREVMLSPRTIPRLRRLIALLRKERGRRLDAGRVLDIVIAEAWNARRSRRTPGKNSE